MTGFRVRCSNNVATRFAQIGANFTPSGTAAMTDEPTDNKPDLPTQDGKPGVLAKGFMIHTTLGAFLRRNLSREEMEALETRHPNPSSRPLRNLEN